jgi:quinol monooxygenase YgiN
LCYRINALLYVELKEMSTNQITLVCFIKAKGNTKQLVEQKLKYLATMTGQEKGNINYILHVADTDDTLFIIYENWKDQAALDNHMAQPYLQEFLSQTDELLQRPIEATACRRL